MRVSKLASISSRVAQSGSTVMFLFMCSPTRPCRLRFVVSSSIIIPTGPALPDMWMA